MRFDAVQGTRQQRAFEAAVAKPADSEHGHRDQQDHRNGEPRRERQAPAQAERLAAVRRPGPARLLAHSAVRRSEQHRGLAGMEPRSSLRAPGNRRPSPRELPA